MTRERSGSRKRKKPVGILSLKKAAELVRPFVSDDKERLSGAITFIYVDTDDAETPMLVSTDGHRLCTCTFDGQGAKVGTLLEPKTLKLASIAEGVKFPEWKRVVPSNPPCFLRADLNNVELEVRRLYRALGKPTHPLRIDTQARSVDLDGADGPTNHSGGFVMLPTWLTAPEQIGREELLTGTFNLNPRYLLKALKTLQKVGVGGDVDFCAEDTVSPCVFGGGPLMHVIMPMRY